MMNADDIFFRIRSHWQLKLGLGGILTVGFLAVYHTLQTYPLFPVTIMEPTWIDRAIPFTPSMVYLYESLWFFMPIAPWLMKSKEEFFRYCKSFVLISLVGFTICLLWPTSCPRPSQPTDQNVAYQLLVHIDRELNAFPSFHVIWAIFHGFCCHTVFRDAKNRRILRGLIWIWM